MIKKLPGPYREELFQWIWQNLEFNCSGLRTTCGKSVDIIDTGKWNHGAGPDFLHAHVHIDGKDWFGSVEIHKHENEWFDHQHHLDEHFNSVILHVVYEGSPKAEIKTLDNFNPFTLVLKPHITKKLYRLLEAKQERGISCSGNIAFINQKAFEKQIEIVHQEYLEFKINELLEVYDASLPVSAAWKKCLISRVYKTLGIPANKKQMINLAQQLLSEHDLPEDVHSFTEEVKKIAFDSGEIHWVRSGMRPASHPRLRVNQAAILHFGIIRYPFQNFFKNEPAKSWSELTGQVDPSALPGKSRLNLVRQIVYLPALYLLGDLLQSNKLRRKVLEIWKSPAQQVPPEVKKPFQTAGFDVNRSTNIIGLAHQYKRYCKEKNCHRCEVFKKAIRS